MNEALSWDEFRLVKAISDSGSLGGAAEILGLNHSTVFRRLAALETTVGARLFERSREGYQPTVAGDEMIALAITMADSIIGFERKLAGRDLRPTGQLRVTTAEAIGQQLLPAIMAQFRAQNSGVVVELKLSNQMLNLSRRDADVAIRLTNDPPEALVGRRLCAVRSAVYYRRDLASSLGSQPLDWRRSWGLATVSARLRGGAGSRLMSVLAASSAKSTQPSAYANSRSRALGRRCCPASSATSVRL